MNRRDVLRLGGGAAVLCALPFCVGYPPLLASEWTKPTLSIMYHRSLLSKAWEVTEGKMPAEMYEALTRMFGAFPIWFTDEQGTVVILGVGNYSEEMLEEHKPYILKGHMLCDVRIIRMMKDGVMAETDIIDRPMRGDNVGYWSPMLIDYDDKGDSPRGYYRPQNERPR